MVQLNKKLTNRIKENLKTLPIWKLSIFLGQLEQEIIERKKQGESSDSGQMKKKRCIRGMYRRELLNKLKEWEKGGNDGIQYSDLLDLDLVQEKIICEDENIIR